LAVMVADEELGRKRITWALQELFPNASLTISIPPHETPW
jgi:hypothetical protein